MKVTPSKPAASITFKTTDRGTQKGQYQWWNGTNEKERCSQLLSTAAYLKESQNYRQRQAAIYARLYGNLPLFSFVGSNMSKMDQQTGLPIDRPTFNIIQACIDTVTSRITQSKPSPTFLTDNSDYKQRRLAKQLNNFIQGELYQTKSYEKATLVFRDALVEGTGILQIYETEDNKVGVDRVLLTELLVDASEAMYGEPRQIYRTKLMDRRVLAAIAPKFKAVVDAAAAAYPDNSSESSKAVSDLVMVVEGWHLPSGKNTKDGRHTIATSAGTVLDEVYTKDRFPFAFLHYSPRLLGFWSQGLAEQLMGTQLEINSLLYTMSRGMKLMGVPRIFIEEGSKVTKSSFNNDIGTLVYYKGIKPSIEINPILPPEMYAQLQRMIDYGFQQSGVSMMQASSQKPAGLNSGEAIRSYDDISTDRLATTAKRYDNFFVDLTYLITDLAKDIAIRDGKYQTIYPNKDGTKQIDLPEVKFLNDPFVVQVFNQSSLPKDPAGRMQKVAEMVQSGMISIKEGRRLLDYPDLGQIEKLANAGEERIFQYLDKIVEDGEYNPPDTFMDPGLAMDLSTQYYNLYASAKLEEERCEMIRNFFTQAKDMVQSAAQPAPGAAPMPQATAQPLPQSPLVPNAVGAAA